MERAVVPVSYFESNAMRFLHNLKLRFSPPRRTDPDFGGLVFMFIPNAPERSYWECEWKFPRTGSVVSIRLPGSEDGPTAGSRQFYLNLPGHFDQILTAVRPKLEYVFANWLQQELPRDIFSAVKLTGFGVEDPRAEPIKWDVAFETTGETWLGITIPLVGNEPQEAVVDT